MPLERTRTIRSAFSARLCRRTFERHAQLARDMDATIRDVLAIAPSIEFQRGVRERIGRSRAAASHTIWWSALAAAAALLLVGKRPTNTVVGECGGWQQV